MTDPYFIVELTTRCNFDCMYCYNIWKDDSARSERQLSFSQFRQIFDRICEQTAIRGVTLAGGEPLMHEDLHKIAAYLNDKGIRSGITTNGSLLGDTKIKELIACGIIHFEVSLPSINSGSFQTLCRSGELKEVRRALLNIRQHGAKLTVSCVISKMNYTEITDIIELAVAFGADYFVLNRFIAGGNGLKYRNRLATDQEQLSAALRMADSAAEKFKIPVTAAVPVEHCLLNTRDLTNLHFGTCGCGDAKWVIDPWGNLRTCEQNPEAVGNLLEMNFSVLAQKPAVLRFRNDDLYQDCKSKKCYERCGGGCRFGR